jgi:hypothetical protein
VSQDVYLKLLNTLVIPEEKDEGRFTFDMCLSRHTSNLSNYASSKLKMRSKRILHTRQIDVVVVVVGSASFPGFS